MLLFGSAMCVNFRALTDICIELTASLLNDTQRNAHIHIHT